MAEIIVQGVFVLAATLMGGLLTLWASRSGDRLARLQAQNRRLLAQVAAYHLLEDLYAADRAQEQNCAAKTVKTEYRNRVVELHQCARPEMTAIEAQKALAG